MDENTFLTAVYCTVDDLYQRHCAPHKPRRPGVKATMSDSEVLTLALLAQWHPVQQETRVLRFAHRHWRGYFPRLLSQSAFNRRCRDLWGAFAVLSAHLADQITAWEGGEAVHAVLDGVPVPVMRRCRGERHRLFADQAGIGHGGSDKEWYYGVHLLTVVTDAGAITGWTTAPANTDVHWSAEALLRWRHDPTAPPPHAAQLADVLPASHGKGGQRRGPTGPLAPSLTAGHAPDDLLIADRAFRGAAWRDHWRQQYHTTVLTRADYLHGSREEQRQWGIWLSSFRQITEQVNQSLTTVFGLPFPQARSWWGLLTRVGAKVTAHNLSLLLNMHAGLPPFTPFHPFG